MNKRAREVTTKAAKSIGLVWTGDALPYAMIRSIIEDIDNELGKLKWVGDDEGWNKAIETVRKELRDLYED